MNETIIALFEQTPGEFLSGEQLSERLNVSRTAIWKHIETLRKQGYQFEAVPRKGYRLVGKPDKLDAGRLEQLLASRTKRMGRSLHYYDTVTTTQTVVQRMAEDGAPEGTLVIAEEQTEGRGRMGRKWHSPKGKGISMSVLLRPRVPLHFTPQLTLLTAVALCRAIRKMTGVEAGIKWPNDLLVEGKKISGILLESSAEDEQLRYVVAGIGVSVNLQASDYPEELAAIATSLRAASGSEHSREELIAEFLQQFEELYELYHEQGFAPIKLLWEALSVTLHKPVRRLTANGVVEGIADSIDESGVLNVRMADGSIVKVYSGEISHG